LTKPLRHQNRENTFFVYPLKLDVDAVEKGKSAVILTKTQNRIAQCLTSDGLRLTATAFVRERKLGAKLMLFIILHRVYTSLQLELDDFYEGTGCAHISKQAFSKARRQLNPEFVREFLDMTAEEAAKDKTMPLYEGMRLIAIDGSDNSP
jgi:hypothetical protein